MASLYLDWLDLASKISQFEWCFCWDISSLYKGIIELVFVWLEIEYVSLWTSNGEKGSVKWRCEHAQSRGFLGNFVNLHNATS